MYTRRFLDLFRISSAVRGMFSSSGTGKLSELAKDGKPVLSLPESGDALYRLLCIAYPERSLETYSLAARNLDGIWAVHEAANKYLFIAVQELLEKMLEAPALVKTHSHRIFAIARLRGLRDLAEKAALCTLKSPVCPKGLAFPEMDLITASSMQSLYEFHHQCGPETTISSTQAKSWRMSYSPSKWTDAPYVWWGTHSHGAGCGATESTHDYIHPTPWFASHMKRLANSLRAIPAESTVEPGTINLVANEGLLVLACDMCSGRVDDELGDRARDLATEVKESNLRLVKQPGVLGF
ncbi:hypothetical protein B0H16DRAFT_1687696 [Mycena metata]|uniref:BTB domain-containing protein n=1 Tax=Mycena metata TaxID=1033252 RepID=A0AAD7JIX4_9AGAR|nr:hypothetical protein B0H16DRAFT_1687696 [Mycena metata]